MTILIDTDILSEIQRARNTVVCSRAAAYERTHGPLSLSVLTVFEGVAGWFQKGRPERAATLMEWVSKCEVIDFDRECARLAGEIDGALTRKGRPIGVVDVGLAATAISHGRVLITGNTTHYEYVREAGFKVEIENWRDPP